MSANTQYNIVINDEVVETKSKKAQAVSAAKALFDADPTTRVVVQTGAGTEVEVLEPKGRHAKPWTRVQEHNLELEVPEGYTVAYTRTRVGALVARADDKSDWIVITADDVQHVENTVQARELTNALATSHKEAQAEARAEADRVKAEAKTKREQERKEKAEAKAAEKEAKAQAKAEAKAAKEAEEAAQAEGTEAA